MSQATVTAKTGPASTVTAQVIQNITSVVIDFPKKTIQIKGDGGLKEFDLSDVATLTDVITSGDHVITMST